MPKLRAALTQVLADSLRQCHFRGKGRVLDWLAPRTGERVARVHGCQVSLDLSDLIQRQIFLGTFEPEETATARRILHPGMTFVDVGANVGYFTLLAAAAVGLSGRVVAFEPGPYAFARLRATLDENQLRQVEAFQIGLSDDSGEVSLYVPKTTGNYSPTMAPNPGGTAVVVQVRKLDDCLDELKIDQVDVLKMDVEGHEPKVLAGAARALKNGRVRAVLCEFNDPWLRHGGSSAQKLYEQLVALGFTEEKERVSFEAAPLQNRFLRWQKP